MLAFRRLVIFKLISIYCISCIILSYIYINTDLSGKLLIGFDFKSRITNSDIYYTILFLLPFLLSFYFGCISQNFLSINCLSRGNSFNLTRKSFSHKLKFFNLSSFFVIFTLIFFSVIISFTFVANQIGFTERTIESRLLKNKLSALLYPFYGYSCSICVLKSSILSTRLLFFIILISSAILVSYYEISRDYLLIITPVIFFYRKLPFVYIILSTATVFICLCLDISYRTGILLSSFNIISTLQSLISFIFDFVHYLTSFNVLNTIDQISSDPEIPFTLKKLLYNIQPFPISWVSNDPYTQGILHDSVRPRSLFSCLFEIHFIYIFLYMFIFGFLFEYSYRLLADYRPLVIVICFICFLSFFQYYPRGSLRFMHLSLFLIFLSKVNIKRFLKLLFHK